MRITISIRQDLYDEISEIIEQRKINNRSEIIERWIRAGMKYDQ